MRPSQEGQIERFFMNIGLSFDAITERSVSGNKDAADVINDICGQLDWRQLSQALTSLSMPSLPDTAASHVILAVEPLGSAD
jgi:hypothetical protein